MHLRCRNLLGGNLELLNDQIILFYFIVFIFAGGILDRVDSYIFTGALAYSFIKTILPLYGV